MSVNEIFGLCLGAEKQAEMSETSSKRGYRNAEGTNRCSEFVPKQLSGTTRCATELQEPHWVADS